MMRDVIAAISISLLLTLAAQLLARSEEPSTKAPTIMQGHDRHGFTLIEISIVLVIIGFIVGGVLVGRDLIKAAEVRATVTQIEKYNQAANTFFGKYGYLPGDIPDPIASNFGFAARGQYGGEGDGNGVLQGIWSNVASSATGNLYGAGETVMFWVDLSKAGLIEGGFTKGSPNVPVVTYTDISDYFPPARLGNGNYFYVWSGCCSSAPVPPNYFGLSAVSGVNYQIDGNPGLTVLQAYQIDQKIDDGMPQSGSVSAFYIGGTIWPTWAGNSANTAGTAFTAATPSSSTTCFDNGGNAGQKQQYSIEVSNGNNVNCALSFRMQAGD